MLMQVGIEELTQAIVRDLQIEHVDVLQAVKATSMDKATEIWCECIDDDELEDQEDAIAGDSNPEIAKKTYQDKPTLFFVKIQSKKLKASLMSKNDIKIAKQMVKDKVIKITKLF